MRVAVARTSTPWDCLLFTIQTGGATFDPDWRRTPKPRPGPSVSSEKARPCRRGPSRKTPTRRIPARDKGGLLWLARNMNQWSQDARGVDRESSHPTSGGTSREAFKTFREDGAPTNIAQSAVFATMARRVSNMDFRPANVGVGDRVGRFELDQVIGHGAFSRTYRGRHAYLGYEVAVKILFDSDQRSAAELLREAQTLAILKHDNVVRVIDADIAEGTPFIVMELLSGKDLRRVLAEHGPLAEQRAADLLEAIGSVLIEQEALGVLHLDIKPSNIVVRSDGRPCLVDYGLAAPHPASGPLRDPNSRAAVVGTPAYMAPEQASGLPDHRSDLFALGLTAWECLTGRPARAETWRDSSGPMVDRSEWQFLHNIITTQIASVEGIRPGIDPGLVAILRALTADDPAKRYQSACDLVADLDTLRRGESPLGAMRGTAFVAIPFTEDFTGPMSAIRAACVASGLSPRRLDQHHFFGDVWSQCVLEIDLCKVVVADFTPEADTGQPNANVLTEAAHARALGKPLAILTQARPEDMPFDWRGVSVTRYDDRGDGLAELDQLLQVRLPQLIASAAAKTAPWSVSAASPRGY